MKKSMIISLLADILVAVTAGIAGRTGAGSLDSVVTARDFSDLASMSEVIVTGTVVADAGLQNTARDPRDLSRPHPLLVANAQFYRVSVDAVLKGRAEASILVGSTRSESWRKGPLPLETNSANFVPLVVGKRYALMLRADVAQFGQYALAFEPSKFELGDGAKVVTKLRNGNQLFPEISQNLFLAKLRAAIGTAGLVAPPGGVLPRPVGSTPAPGAPTPPIMTVPGTSD